MRRPNAGDKVSESMTLNDLLHNIHALEDALRVYERKYAMLSDVFYAAYRDGEEPPDDAWVRDWTAWASGYEVLQDLREQYRAAIARLQAEQPSTPITDRIAAMALPVADWPQMEQEIEEGRQR